MNWRLLIFCLLAVTSHAQDRVQCFTVGTPAHPYPLMTNVVSVLSVPQVPSIETNGNHFVLHLPLAANEALWGFGERFDSLNQRSHVVESWLVDAWGGGNRSYFAVPFFISSAGYGLFVNHTGKVVFDCGATKTNDLLIDIPEGAEVFRFKGTPAEILSDCAKLVGRPQPPPDWAFTPWISRNSYLSAYDVDRTLDLMDKHGLKAGAVVLEAWAEGLQNFKFDPHRYPDTKAWIERLHARGYRVICWETPSLWDSASTYPIAKEKGYLVLKPDGSELRVDWLENAVKMDFRKPEARQWWTELHEPLIAMGVDGFKTDGGERMPDEWFHNLHPFYYQRAVLDAFKAEGRPGITFARSASAPCAGNSMFWGGDQRSSWNDLPNVVRAGLSAAASGFPLWGHDIGGYSGTPEKKLYIRWLELGAFSPIMQWHGTTPREPWYYDEETVRIAKFYLDLRWRLQPYLQNLASSKAPFWRPLFLQFPSDENVLNLDDEFMLGDDLLVAPMLTESDEREVYLPAGDWLNVWTQERLTGPKRIHCRVGLQEIPVFARKETGVFAPPPKPAEIQLQLAGETNDRGIVPSQRLLQSQPYEKVFLTIVNHSTNAISGNMTVTLPASFAALPSTNQPYRADAGSEARLAFYLTVPPELPIGSYPVRITCPAGDKTVTLVKPPPWAQKMREDGFVALAETNETSATFHAPSAGNARLSLGSSNGIIVWLNDEQVFEKPVYRSPEPDEDVVPVHFKAGANTLRVKLPRPAGAIGPNGFYLRVAPE